MIAPGDTVVTFIDSSSLSNENMRLLKLGVGCPGTKVVLHASLGQRIWDDKVVIKH